MIWSRSYYSITLLSSVQRPSTRFVKIPPKSPSWVGNRNICDGVVSLRWTHNITSIISTPIYLWWFDHVRITLSRFSALCNVRQHDLSKSPPKSPSWVGNRNICDGVVSDTLNTQYHINNINAHIFVMIWSRSYYSITLLSSVQRPSTRFVKIPPKSPSWVGNRNICDGVVSLRWTHNITSIISTPIYLWWFDHVRITLSRFSALCNVRQHDLSKSPLNPLLGSVIETYVMGLYRIRWTHNITSIISTPIYLWWFDHVRITLSRFSALCNVRQHDLSKSPPKSPSWVGNRNICDGVVSLRWTHNITSIISTPIYLWWFDHVRITLSRFSALCNVRQHDLSKSPLNPILGSVIETYVMGLYRYVEHTISHQ